MRYGLNLAAVTLFICLLAVTSGRAAEHDQLTPLLGELEGWTAGVSQGTSLVAPGLKMINAHRQYRKGEAVLDVTIVVNSGPGPGSELKEFSMENDASRVRTRAVDGFWVTSTHVKKRGAGQILVYLAQNRESNSLLSVDYRMITEDEALPALRGLDWGKIKLVVEGLL